MPCRMPSFLPLAIVGCCCFVPPAPAASTRSAQPDSSAAPREMRVFSDRALFDLHPRPEAKPDSRSTRALDDSLRLPSPGVAAALSMMGTAVPIVMLANWGDPDQDDRTLISAGVTLAVLGPGLGYFYGGVPGDASPGQLLRAGSLGLAALTVYGPWMDSESDVGGAVSTLVISSIVFAGSTLYDLGNTPPAVARANQRRREAAMAVGVRPLPGGPPALALTVRF